MNSLAQLVYYKGLREEIEQQMSARIAYLVGANNELMKELEQWERVGERLENATGKRSDVVRVTEDYEQGDTPRSILAQRNFTEFFRKNTNS